MASSKVETAITWAAAASQNLSANNTWYLSDAFAFNIEDWKGEVHIYADNASTPASGDTLEVGILYSCGSVDGSAGDDFVNADNYEFLAWLDSYNNDDGTGIVSRTVPVRVTPKSAKLAVRGPAVATRNIVARAALITHRGQ